MLLRHYRGPVSRRYRSPGQPLRRGNLTIGMSGISWFEGGVLGASIVDTSQTVNGVRGRRRYRELISWEILATCPELQIPTVLRLLGQY